MVESGSGVRVGLGEGAPSRARVGFKLEVVELVIGAKALPMTGDNSEVGLLPPLAASKARSRVEVAAGASEVLGTAVQEQGFRVIFWIGLGGVVGPSVIVRVVGTELLTVLVTVFVLQVLSIGMHGARSSCCTTGDDIPAARSSAEPGDASG